MTYFEQALSAPELHFKQFREIEPLLCNGRPIVRRTSLSIEAEVRWKERNFLLYLPLSRETLHRIEELTATSLERRCGPLISNRIFYNELSMCNSLGNKSSYDIILQEIPRGMMLGEALLHYKSRDLKDAIRKMKVSLDNIGFRHNNLHPSNIVICDNGIACPLRYWYAEWFDFTDNDISHLEELIEQHNIEHLEETKRPLYTPDATEIEPADIPHEGILRCIKGHRYGFVDSDGVQIVPFIYTAATNFHEGRAVVTRNNKMGAIDNHGKKVIPVIYNSLEFDIATGLFTATRNNYRYTIDYDGNIIHRTTIEEEKR